MPLHHRVHGYDAVPGAMRGDGCGSLDHSLHLPWPHVLQGSRAHCTEVPERGGDPEDASGRDP